MRYILIYLLLFTFSTSFAQDSTRLVQTEAWRMYRLIHDVKAYHRCLIVLDSAQSQIESGRALLVKAEEGIQIQTVQIDTQTALIEALQATIINNEVMNHESRKGLLKKLRKAVFVAIIEGVVIVLILVSR